VIRNTPKKVRRQPPMNLETFSVVAFSKSRYKIALPIITDKVNITNCTGMTCVESNRCSALLTYLTCITAVEIRTAKRAYVTGVVRALQSVEESIDATPLVERAVYPPAYY
jgi:hypothetical protein